jgi:hypothetical protein
MEQYRYVADVGSEELSDRMIRDNDRRAFAFEVAQSLDSMISTLDNGDESFEVSVKITHGPSGEKPSERAMRMAS